jgi:hypothetical protein
MKRELHLIVYVPIKRWPTCERAEMDEDEVSLELTEDAEKEMLFSGLKKAIHPKPTDLALWKKRQVHESRGIIRTIYK